ncbi:MAG: PrsW family glutamic-type intramembrane protease [Terriglobales bacterium]
MATSIGAPIVVHPSNAGAGAPTPPWRRYLKDLLWATRLTVSVVVLLAGRTWPSFRHQLACVVVLAILAWPVRSVRWGTLYNFFVVGFLFALPIVGLQYFIDKALWAGQSTILGSVLLAPTTEEVGKILPLVLLLAVGRLGFRNSYGACDLMLCGAALGAGLGLFEDSLRASMVFPAPASPSLFGIAVFPDSYGGFIGHSGSTALIGLSLGCFLYAVRWRRWLLLGLGGVLFGSSWMMIDHGLSNYANNASLSTWFFPVRWIWIMDRHGELSPYVFLILMVSTIVVERVLLWRFWRGYPRLSIGCCMHFIKRPLRQGWGYPQLRSVIMRLRSLLLYMLRYRRLAFLLMHWKGDLPPNMIVFGPLIARYTGEVAVSQIAVRRS